MIKIQRNTPAQSGATNKGIQFLNLSHVTAKGVVFTIEKVTTDKPDSYGNPYVVYFSADGQKYSKGYKPTSDALADLVELFGEEEKKWVGKKVLIGKTSDPDDGDRLSYSKA